MLDSPFVDDLIDLALREDLALGDPTTELTVDADSMGVAVVVARERLTVCGLPLLHKLAHRAALGVEVEVAAKEGVEVSRESTLATLTGTTRALLMLERTMLNFLQRMCGIATHTRAVVRRAKGMRIVDTRKTTPGWRLLEKYAVRTGGAQCHRMSLGDMILVKNNHIDARGGDVAATLDRVMKGRAPYMAVEVEVRSLEELAAALPFHPEIVMLDNMNDRMVARAVRLIRESTHAGRAPLIEVSGGVTPERLSRLRALGVDIASMSALVGAARTVDISMRISPRSRTNHHARSRRA